jgi:hypothetical protein
MFRSPSTLRAESPERNSAWVGSSLTCKYKTRVDVTVNDKHSGLQLYGINYDRKKFYKTGPRNQICHAPAKKIKILVKILVKKHFYNLALPGAYTIKLFTAVIVAVS